MIDVEEFNKLMDDLRSSISKLNKISEMQDEMRKIVENLSGKEKEMDSVLSDYDSLTKKNQEMMDSLKSDIVRLGSETDETITKEKKKLSEEIKNLESKLTSLCKDSDKELSVIIGNNYDTLNDKMDKEITRVDSCFRNESENIKSMEKSLKKEIRRLDGRADKNREEISAISNSNEESHQMIDKRVKIAYLIAICGIILGVIGIIV